MKTKIESLLFVSPKPLTAKNIFNFLKKQDKKIKLEKVEQALQELIKEYNVEGKGINLMESQDQYQFVTSVENAEFIKKFNKDERTGELSQPSLETLTIVAYRGPITKVNIEQIRGVNCSLILRNLMIRGLIDIDEKEGTEIYKVTPDFLKFLGVNSVKELPEYEKLHTVENLEQFLANHSNK